MRSIRLEDRPEYAAGIPSNVPRETESYTRSNKPFYEVYINILLKLTRDPQHTYVSSREAKDSCNYLKQKEEKKIINHVRILYKKALQTVMKNSTTDNYALVLYYSV